MNNGVFALRDAFLLILNNFDSYRKKIIYGLIPIWGILLKRSALKVEYENLK